jgi:hypothetical protein
VQISPLQDLQPAVIVLNESPAAFDPVAVVAVQNPVDRADFGAMDVAADDAAGMAPARFGDNRVLVVSDVLARILDIVPEIGRQRSMETSKLAAHPVEHCVDV